MAEHERPFGETLLEYLEAAVRANGVRAGEVTPEAREWLGKAGVPVAGLATPEEIKARLPQLTVRKVEGYLPIPEEILMDEGVIPDTRPKVKIRWRTRLRWRVNHGRERFGLWAYWKITGDHIRTDDDEG